MRNVTIVGLGYVGLPLALLTARKGFRVTGVDINKKRIEQLRDQGLQTGQDEVSKQIKSSSITFSQKFDSTKTADVVVVCVPTPVDNEKIPDLTPLKSAVKAVAPHLKKNSLLIIESTVNPGVCDEVVTPIISKLSGLSLETDIHIAHCPERINPGDTRWNVENIARVVGASSSAGLKLATEFYESILTAEVKAMGTIKEAEAVKIIENSFRDINIAFVNELAMSFQKLGINIENVIEGASTKPFAFMPHHPGCGVGGHCIPVDPYYLIEHARGYGFDHRFLKLARTINNSMPEYTVNLLDQEVIKLGKSNEEIKVGLLGMSYKANIADKRESPAYQIHAILTARNYRVLRFDPYLDDCSDVEDLDSLLLECDSLVLTVGHEEFLNIKPALLKKNAIKILIDGRNVFKEKVSDIKGLGVAYKGIGIN